MLPYPSHQKLFTEPLYCLILDEFAQFATFKLFYTFVSDFEGLGFISTLMAVRLKYQRGSTMDP